MRKETERRHTKQKLSKQNKEDEQHRPCKNAVELLIHGNTN